MEKCLDVQWGGCKMSACKKTTIMAFIVIGNTPPPSANYTSQYLLHREKKDQGRKYCREVSLLVVVE
jgi:hypothetical protein